LSRKQPKSGVADYDLDVLIGTVVHDQELGLVGSIEAIESYPQQEIMIVAYQDRQVMIPLHPDLIIEMIPGERLVMDLPEGLLDV